MVSLPLSIEQWDYELDISILMVDEVRARMVTVITDENRVRIIYPSRFSNEKPSRFCGDCQS